MWKRYDTEEGGDGSSLLLIIVSQKLVEAGGFIEESSLVSCDVMYNMYRLGRMGVSELSPEEMAFTVSERRALEEYRRRAEDLPVLDPPLMNRILLWETHQRIDETQFARDTLHQMLGLDKYQVPPIHDRSVPTPSLICEPQHALLRARAMWWAASGYAWVMDCFLDFPGVYVADEESFVAAMEAWKVDPCDQLLES